MPTERLSRCTLFRETGNGRKMVRGKSLKTLTSGLARVDAGRLLGLESTRSPEATVGDHRWCGSTSQSEISSLLYNCSSSNFVARLSPFLVLFPVRIFNTAIQKPKLEHMRPKLMVEQTEMN